MSNEPRKPGHGILIASILFGALILYPLSTGPLIWIKSRVAFPEWVQGTLDMIYYPLNVAYVHAPERIQKLHSDYNLWWSPHYQ